MRTMNLDPFWRTSIGFDRLFDLMDESLRFEPEDHYPPEHRAQREKLMVSPSPLQELKPEQVNVTVNQNQLIVSAAADDKQDKGEYLYRGIAGRSFERRFSADYVVVKSASLDEGLLQIELERELPEAMKPRRTRFRPATPLARTTKSAPSSIPKSHKNGSIINGLRWPVDRTTSLTGRKERP